MTTLISTRIAARDTVINILALGGSTLSLIAGVPSVTSGYAVSLPNHESKHHLLLDGPGRVSTMVELVEQYITSKRAYLSQPLVQLGAWMDGDTLYLDLTEVYHEFETAVRLGWKRNQLAIYDIGRGEEIKTSPGRRSTLTAQQGAADQLARENGWSPSPFEVIAETTAEEILSTVLDSNPWQLPTPGGQAADDEYQARRSG